MSTYSFYLPTNSIILGLYFSGGIIMPEGAYDKTLNTVQNLRKDSITLSKERWVKDANVSIEVILDDKEVSSLKEITANFYECAFAIPVSRIKTIYFLDPEKMEEAVWNITKNTAFIPARLLKIDTASVNLPELPAKSSVGISQRLLDQRKRYNILLGGFAFMKMSKQPGADFPEYYFSTFANFNDVVAEDFKKANYSLDKKYSQRLCDLFSSKADTEWSRYTSLIYGNVSISDVEKLAQKENIRVNKKFGHMDLDSFKPDSLLFDMALLATFGENKSKGVEDLLSFLSKSELSSYKFEEISLLFGLHIGYYNLRKSYKVAQLEIPAKVELETRIDYYLIESIYQFVFNSVKNNKHFPYLNEIIPEITTYELNKNAYYILNTPVIVKKKEKGWQDYFSVYSDDVFKAMAEAQMRIYIPGHLPNYEESIKYFKTQYQGVLKKFATAIVEKDRVLQTEKPVAIPKPADNLVAQNVNSVISRTLNSQPTDDYEDMEMRQLKEIAKKKGIKNLLKFKSTKKGMSLLIDLLRNSPDIL